MSAAALLAEVRSAGVTVSADGDRLRFRGPAEARTPERDAALREHKTALLALLATERAEADRVRVEAAIRIFDADPIPPITHGGMTCCRACHTERNVEEPTCPVCHPDPTCVIPVVPHDPVPVIPDRRRAANASPSAPPLHETTTTPGPDLWETARNITRLSPDELRDYEAELAAASDDDPNIDHDRAALRMAKAMLAGRVAVETAA